MRLPTCIVLSCAPLLALACVLLADDKPVIRPSDPSGNLVRTRNSFINDSRQLFVKVSYLFRF